MADTLFTRPPHKMTPLERELHSLILEAYQKERQAKKELKETGKKVALYGLGAAIGAVYTVKLIKKLLKARKFKRNEKWEKAIDSAFGVSRPVIESKEYKVKPHHVARLHAAEVGLREGRDVLRALYWKHRDEHALDESVIAPESVNFLSKNFAKERIKKKVAKKHLKFAEVLNKHSEEAREEVKKHLFQLKPKDSKDRAALKVIHKYLNRELKPQHAPLVEKAFLELGDSLTKKKDIEAWLKAFSKYYKLATIDAVRESIELNAKHYENMPELEGKVRTTPTPKQLIEGLDRHMLLRGRKLSWNKVVSVLKESLGASEKEVVVPILTPREALYGERERHLNMLLKLLSNPLIFASMNGYVILPSSATPEHIVAHELTHVVQTRRSKLHVHPESKKLKRAFLTWLKSQPERKRKFYELAMKEYPFWEHEFSTILVERDYHKKHKKLDSWAFNATLNRFLNELHMWFPFEKESGAKSAFYSKVRELSTQI